MKKFQRIIITIIVLAIALGTAHHAMKASQNNNTGTNGQQNVENNNEQDVQKNDGQNNQNQIDKTPEETKSLEQVKLEVDTLVQKITDAQQIDTFSEMIEKGMLGVQVDEYMSYFEINGVSASVQRVTIPEGTKIVVSPMPDFLDIQEFYYDQEGKLMLYKLVSSGVGGYVDYYFSNDTLLQRENKFEEGVEPGVENENEIIQKATKVYDAYSKK